ncbi:MAG: hypothetical protein DI564_00920 [Rhodanobacter denitrificans]|uniref:Uncharacterized protein n=1 Tax=Rhodanobacter denitrificans TaxID=666685 RepID=A0A2W5KRZ3_9GAMM|nr:MAG: hypothetical protein DI564_00920 [Rhodanobacter denitrificans]
MLRSAVPLVSSFALLWAAAAGAQPAASPQPFPVPTPAGAAGGDCDADGLCLSVTVAPADPADPDACGTQTGIVAEVGDQLAWCYTLTNHSDRTLLWHTLRDDANGTLFSQRQQPVEPGASLRYVRLRTATEAFAGTVTATWSASAERPGYHHDDTEPFAYVDAADGTPAEMTGGFAGTRSAPVTLPFELTFFGNSSDQLCVGKNGAVEFGTLSCVLPMVYGMPSNYAAAVIAPAWTDLSDTDGEVRYKTIGAPGQRRFVIEWRDMVLGWPAMPGYTFELVIEEETGDLVYQYASTGSGLGDSGDAGSRSVVGVQPDRLSALVYSSFQPRLGPGKAIRWSPLLPDALSAVGSVEADIGAAELTLPIPELNGHAATGVSISQPLVLINSGTRALHWSADRYPATTRPSAPVAVSSGGAIRHATPRRPLASAAGRPQPSPGGAGLLGEVAVPAFGVEFAPNVLRDYTAFDLRAPATATTVLSDMLDTHGLSISGGDFVGEDFDRQWLIDWRSNRLHTIDTASGALQTIGQAFPQGAVAGEGWMGMAWDPAEDVLYAASVSAACGWSGLYRIDRDTAAASFVGPVVTGRNVCLVDIAIDQNGQMYGLDISEDALVRIDKHTGIGELVGSLGVDAEYEQGLTFDRAAGTLYWTAFVGEQGAVATIDPLSGVPSFLGPTRDAHQVTSLAIARRGGDCAQPADVPWLLLDVEAGVVEPGAAPAFVQVGFDATALAAGRYEAQICVFSNDPAYRHRPAVIPVSFLVELADQVFADGFD